MTIQEFEKILDELQTNGEAIFADWLRENSEMISYNAWERRVIVGAAKELSVEAAKRGGEVRKAQQPDYSAMGKKGMKKRWGDKQSK